MNPVTEQDEQTTYMQERAIETPTDDSLPAAQVIEEQNKEAEQNYTPRFIP
ncbi:MAG TPA: hypothetical protein PKE35_08415 [Anaerolineales bacterium]|nr:hypothetical protein [Anaerolineales bacterium]HMV95270.1 hypothetical protein [Anaerolineales bacterium]HMX19078.1 hypothetical protein [Anaerolineales bacterium]HMX74264.1 hypothetical protein [Anaerolineales bacterium]HMZ43030.1 hypothetical protein [Anaerolineales bacterium]